jgi:hypothetical protein
VPYGRDFRMAIFMTVILFKRGSMAKTVGEQNFSMPDIIVCTVFLLNLQNKNKKNFITSEFLNLFLLLVSLK